MRFLRSPFARTPPLFGQAALAATLVCAAALGAYFLLADLPRHPDPARNGPVTFLSLLLPDAVTLSPALRWAFAALFLLTAPLWWSRRLLPLSPVLCVVGFLGLVAAYIERATQVTHVAHLTSLILLVHLVWYVALGPEIRRAQADRRFWQTPLYPAWAHWLAVFCIGSFYGLSGWMKVITAGPGWANGVSMQLWVSLWGDESSVATRLILEHRWLAQLLQALTLLAECGAPLAIISRRLRPPLGLLLISFHVGAILVFKWGFHANAALIALYFFPFDTLASQFERRWHASAEKTPPGFAPPPNAT